MRPAIPLLFLLLAVGCTDNGIGRKCVNPVDAGVKGVQVSSPSLECPSRLCLLTEGTTAGETTVCTDFCETDKDCAAATVNQNKESPTPGLCNTHFVCAIPTVVGPLCCRKMCVCSTDLREGENRDPVDGGVITPEACKPETTLCKNAKPM
jgi:hypothetical protein